VTDKAASNARDKVFNENVGIGSSIVRLNGCSAQSLTYL
jgi:hypothetical protein